MTMVNPGVAFGGAVPVAAKLARGTAPGSDLSACWEFVQSPRIQKIVDREVRRLAHQDADREDLHAQAMVEIVGVLTRDPRNLLGEGALLAYWNRRIPGLVEAAWRMTGGQRFRDGRVVRREFTGGFLGAPPDDGERAGPAIARVALERAAIARQRDTCKAADRADRLAIVREFLDGYADRKAVDCFLGQAEGATRSWGDLARTLGYRDPEHARAAAQRVHAGLVEHLLDRGENVRVTILGIHAGPHQVSGVVFRDGDPVDSWTIEIDDLHGLAALLGGSLNRKVVQVVVNRGMAGVVAHVVQGACLVRGLTPERIEPTERGTQCRSILAGKLPRGLDRGERSAALLALVKMAANRRRVERGQGGTNP